MLPTESLSALTVTQALADFPEPVQETIKRNYAAYQMQTVRRQRRQIRQSPSIQTLNSSTATIYPWMGVAPAPVNIKGRDITLYLVGGTVRDKAAQFDSNDHDWLVIGATEEEMQTNGFERRVCNGITLFRKQKHDYVLPETKYAHFPQFLQLLFNLAVRDLKMNAMAVNVSVMHDDQAQSTMRIIDPFGGLNDIKKKSISHISEDAFCAKNIHLYRALLQHSKYARAGFTLDSTTQCLMQKIGDKLSSERIKQHNLFFSYSRRAINSNLEVYFTDLKQLVLLDKLCPVYGQYFHDESFNYYNDIEIKYLPDTIKALALFIPRDLSKPFIAEKENSAPYFNIDKLIKPWIDTITHTGHAVYNIINHQGIDSDFEIIFSKIDMLNEHYPLLVLLKILSAHPQLKSGLANNMASFYRRVRRTHDSINNPVLEKSETHLISKFTAKFSDPVFESIRKLMKLKVAKFMIHYESDCIKITRKNITTTFIINLSTKEISINDIKWLQGHLFNSTIMIELINLLTPFNYHPSHDVSQHLSSFDANACMLSNSYICNISRMFVLDAIECNDPKAFFTSMIEKNILFTIFPELTNTFNAKTIERVEMINGQRYPLALKAVLLHMPERLAQLNIENLSNVINNLTIVKKTNAIHSIIEYIFELNALFRTPEKVNFEKLNTVFAKLYQSNKIDILKNIHHLLSLFDTEGTMRPFAEFETLFIDYLTIKAAKAHQFRNGKQQSSDNIIKVMQNIIDERFAQPDSPSPSE